MDKKKLIVKYWSGLKKDSKEAGISLDNTISSEDFEIYGDRLAARQIEMIQNFCFTPLNESTLLDLGCGIGRFVKPFTRTFNKVVGVDMNPEILEAAREYLKEVNNFELFENDGLTIPFPDNSFEYVYSGGVLQHIPDINIIVNYFEEGLRTLEPGGILNYSIMVWMIFRKGGFQADRIGAQVRASDIEKILNKTGHDLVAIYSDEKDPLPHFNILIRKNSPEIALKKIEDRKENPIKLNPNEVTKMPIRTGIFEDLKSYNYFRSIWKKNKIKPISFFNSNAMVTFGKYFIYQFRKRV